MVLAQKQKNISMEHNRKPRNKPIYGFTNNQFITKEQEYTMEKRQFLQ